MAINLAAIFGVPDDDIDATDAAITDAAIADADVCDVVVKPAVEAESTAGGENRTHRMLQELRGRVEATVDTCPMVTHWPIVEGTEHFCIWVDDDAPWPEFIPGYHRDFRQPSRLTPLCAARKESDAIDER